MTISLAVMLSLGPILRSCEFSYTEASLNLLFLEQLSLSQPPSEPLYKIPKSVM